VRQLHRRPARVRLSPRGLNILFDLPAIYGVNADNNPDNNRLPYDNRFVTNNIDTSYANGNNFNKLKQGGAALTLDFDLSDTASVKSITAYRELHWVVGMDLDNSPLNFLHTSFSMNQKQFSQELQLTGTALEKKLKYVLGAYYFTESGDLHDYVTFAEGPAPGGWAEQPLDQELCVLRPGGLCCPISSRSPSAVATPTKARNSKASSPTPTA
jgi:hypothetical protein